MAKLTSTDIYGSLLVQGTLTSNGALSSDSTLTGTRLISTVANGTPPLTVMSTSAVANLNSDLLDGQHGSYYLNYNNLTNTPTIPTVGNGTITITAGTGLATGGNFTVNQSGNTTITLNHSNSITSGNTGPGANASPAFGGTFTVPYVSYDAQGHITGTANRTITIPELPAGATLVNLAFSNGTSVIDTYDPDGANAKQFTAGSNITMTAASNNITIASPDVAVTESGSGNGVAGVTANGHGITVTKTTFLTSYTETDTLATVTGRGSTTGTTVTLSNNDALDLTGTAPVIKFNSTTGRTANLFTDATASGQTKTINLGTGAASGSTTNVNIGSTIGGTTTISSPTVSIPGNLTVTGNITVNNVEMVSTSNGVIFEGSSDDANETTLTAINPTADRTISLPDASGTIALTSDLHTRSHAMTSTSDHTAGNWKVFYSNGSGNVIELALSTANTYLKANGVSSAPTFAQVAYSELSGTPTIGDGTLSWAANTTGLTNTTIAASLSGAYSANTTTNRTLSLAVGPALTNLAAAMTGAGTGILRKTGADTYEVVANSTYLTAEADTLATVTGRGATTATAISLTNSTASSSTSTGALIVTGGVGIGGSVNIAGNIALTGASSVSTTTGNLTLSTSAGNGNVIISPNGTGNVGIGTTSPAQKLEVVGNTKTQELIISDTSNVAQATMKYDSTSKSVKFVFA
jgi:hypothetical protein